KLAAVCWVPNLAAALKLTEAVGSALASSAASPKALERMVRKTARCHRIPLAEHEATLERARATLARLEHGLKLAQSRGVLQEFNWRFKFLRQEQPQLSYGVAFAALKSEIARRLAAGDGALPDLTGIVDTVLPIK